ncbi:MAG: hypothetical protein CEE43_11690 [Promethearchaeota archaeon Loki_b32]|nr:MAG: hypothetical protein CEE43_11690 [Candidatus Lokiarchaeota archaeon Loki_b32]
MIILLVFLLRVENTIFSFVILPLFIIIDATLLIWSYFDYISFYTGVKLIFFMKLFHQDNKMLKEVNELKNYIKNNQWFEAKSEFLLFLRKNLKEIYYPISQKLRYHRIIEEFREFCVNIFDTHKSSGYNEKIELFFISLNRVLKYESKNLYEEDFVTPLLESLKYFSDLKRKINRWDKWIKHYVFNNEDFELLIDDQIIQEIEVLKNKLDINKFRNILKAEYSSEKEKDEIYRFYEIFIKEIKKIQSEYFSIFLSVLNLSDFKKLLGLIKNYTTSLENLFMKKLSKKECKKIYNNYKNLLDNIFETDKREILKENLKSLRKYKDDLDRLEIYIDFSKKYKILIFLDFSVINKQYYPIITLKLRTNRLFEFEVSEIFPIMRSEEIREDINQYLKKIAEKNKMKSNN